MQERKQIIILIEMKNQKKDIDLFDFYDIAGAIGNLKYRR